MLGLTTRTPFPVFCGTYSYWIENDKLSIPVRSLTCDLLCRDLRFSDSAEVEQEARDEFRE